MLTDEQLRAEQEKSGHFFDAHCKKCGDKFYINSRYPQVKCVALVDHQYCMGEIVKDEKELTC